VFNVNYFFALTTIISPGQRQLLFRVYAVRRSPEGKAACGPVLLFLGYRPLTHLGRSASALGKNDPFLLE